MPIYDQPEPSRDQSFLGKVSPFETATAGMSSDAMDSMASEAKKMVESAKSGGFRVSENAAQPIRDALLELRGDVDRAWEEIVTVGRTAPHLGGHDYGKAVASFQRRALVEAEGAPSKVLERLSQVLADADKALEIAIKKYRENEDATRQSFRGEV